MYIAQAQTIRKGFKSDKLIASYCAEITWLQQKDSQWANMYCTAILAETYLNDHF